MGCRGGHAPGFIWVSLHRDELEAERSQSRRCPGTGELGTPPPSALGPSRGTERCHVLPRGSVPRPGAPPRSRDTSPHRAGWVPGREMLVPGSCGAWLRSPSAPTVVWNGEGAGLVLGGCWKK